MTKREYYLLHQEEKKAGMREYYQKNKEKWKKYKRDKVDKKERSRVLSERMSETMKEWHANRRKEKEQVEEILKAKEAREKGHVRWQEMKEFEDQGYPLPKLYSTVFITDPNTRQKACKLIWNLSDKQESMVIRQEKTAKATFLTVIRVLKSLGYTEDLKVKEELTSSGWYFTLG